MKKLLALSLILILALPAALADDAPDPIVGAWYAWLEVSEGPALSELSGYTHILMEFVVEPDGRMRYFEIDFTDTDQVLNGPYINGSWKKADKGYTVSVIGSGTGTAYVDGDKLYFPVIQGAYYVFTRSVHMDWYKEILPENLLPNSVKR